MVEDGRGYNWNAINKINSDAFGKHKRKAQRLQSSLAVLTFRGILPLTELFSVDLSNLLSLGP